MALIAQIDCRSCSFTTSSFADVVLVARREDGTEVVLPHPGEQRAALERTGDTLDGLREQGRLDGRTALFCRACGTITHQPDDGSPCHDCGARGKLVVHDAIQTGVLERIGRYIGLVSEPDEPSCPECGTHSLTWKAVAMS